MMNKLKDPHSIWIPFLIFYCIMMGMFTINNSIRITKLEADVREIKKHTHTIEYGEYGIIEDGISFPYARMPALESDPE